LEDSPATLCFAALHSGWQEEVIRTCGSRRSPKIEDALVPAFIVEELDDGRFTVFVPSVPTPFAGAVYILSRERVHLVDIPFTQAIQSVSRWGAGSKELVAAMRGEKRSSRRNAETTA